MLKSWNHVTLGHHVLVCILSYKRERCIGCRCRSGAIPHKFRCLNFLRSKLITGTGFWYGAWWVVWQPHCWTHQWLVYSHLTWRRRGKADPSSDGLLDRCSCDAGGFQSRPKWWVYQTKCEAELISYHLLRTSNSTSNNSIYDRILLIWTANAYRYGRCLVRETL